MPSKYISAAAGLLWLANAFALTNDANLTVWPPGMHACRLQETVYLALNLALGALQGRVPPGRT